jgi:hypothetical protein
MAVAPFKSFGVSSNSLYSLWRLLLILIKSFVGYFGRKLGVRSGLPAQQKDLTGFLCQQVSHRARQLCLPGHASGRKNQSGLKHTQEHFKKTETSETSRKSAGTTKTDVVEPADGGAPFAQSHTHGIRIAAP